MTTTLPRQIDIANGPLGRPIFTPAPAAATGEPIVWTIASPTEKATRKVDEVYARVRGTGGIYLSAGFMAKHPGTRAARVFTSNDGRIGLDLSTDPPIHDEFPVSRQQYDAGYIRCPQIVARIRLEAGEELEIGQHRGLITLTPR